MAQGRRGPGGKVKPPRHKVETRDLRVELYAANTDRSRLNLRNKQLDDDYHACDAEKRWYAQFFFKQPAYHYAVLLAQYNQVATELAAVRAQQEPLEQHARMGIDAQKKYHELVAELNDYRDTNRDLTRDLANAKAKIMELDPPLDTPSGWRRTKSDAYECDFFYNASLDMSVWDINDIEKVEKENNLKRDESNVAPVPKSPRFDAWLDELFAELFTPPASPSASSSSRSSGSSGSAPPAVANQALTVLNSGLPGMSSPRKCRKMRH